MQRRNIRLRHGRRLKQTKPSERRDDWLNGAVGSTSAYRTGDSDTDSNSSEWEATGVKARSDVAGAIEHVRAPLAAWEHADEAFEPAREAREKLAALGG